MIRLRKALVTLGLALAMAVPAAAATVNPFEVIDRAFNIYKDTNDYGQVRAVLGQALREADREGPLPPDFGLFLAVYADTARYDGDPAFALHLTDRGLALLAAEAQPDAEIRNTLIISRAYALADLGRPADALEGAAVAALWLGERFGADARTEFEAEMAKWAKAAGNPDGEGLPEAARIAIDLLTKAEAAVTEGDMATAQVLAARATMPETSGLSDPAVRLVNAWSGAVAGAAFAAQGRHAEAVGVLQAAADLLTDGPWDRRSQARMLPALTVDGPPRPAWDVFVRLGASALQLGDADLAKAAFATAAPLAARPQDRFSLMVQRASLVFREKDAQAAIRLFEDGEAEAQAAGDVANASLARFYAAVVRYQEATADRQALATMLELARKAADSAGGDRLQAEFILSTAASQAFIGGAPGEVALPVAKDAYSAFVARQQRLGSDETGQDAARRGSRRFLELFVDALHGDGG
jgi:tetratricopeptide (TPR) repeat protein